MILLVACAPAPPPDIVVHPATVTTSASTSSWTTTDTSPSTTPSTTTTTTLTTTTAPPQIGSLDLVELDDWIEVHVTTEAGAAPLTGGIVTASIDDDPSVDLRIPQDLDSFTDGEAVFRFARPKLGECTVGAQHDVTVALTDRSGIPSGLSKKSITTSDVGEILPESTTMPDLGSMPAGTLFCSDLSRTGNDGYTYTADVDEVGFEVPTTGDWTIELRWTASADYDLLIYQIDSYGYPTLLDSSAYDGNKGPESVTRKLVAGRTYGFEVAGWSGTPGDWTVELSN